MPFYRATGRDMDTLEPKSIQISARSEFEAIDTAATRGLTEIKLHPYSEREVLLMDFKCFLNAESKPTPRRRLPVPAPRPARVGAPAVAYENAYEKEQGAIADRSLLLRHPMLTISAAVLLAIWVDRGLAALIALA